MSWGIATDFNKLSNFKTQLLKLFWISLPVIPAGLLMKGISIIDQVFANQIGSEFLNTHSFIVYLPFIIAPIGRAMGLPLLVVLNKETEKAGEYISSGMIASLLIGILLSGISLLIEDLFFSMTEIQNLQSTRLYFQLQVFSASFLLCNSFFNFVFVSIGKSSLMFYCYLITFVLNVLGNTLSVTFFQNEEALVGLGVATFLSTGIQLAVQAFFVNKTHQLNFKVKILSYLRRAQGMIFSHFFLNLIGALISLSIAIILQKNYGKALATVFNATNILFEFMFMPLVSLRTAGTGWLIRNLQENSPYSKEAFVVLLCAYSCIPWLLAQAMPGPVLSTAFGLGAPEYGWLAKVLLLKVTFLGAAMLWAIKIDFNEKTHLTTFVSIFSNSLFPIVLIIQPLEHLASNILVGFLCSQVAYLTLLFIVTRGMKFKTAAPQQTKNIHD